MIRVLKSSIKLARKMIFPGEDKSFVDTTAILQEFVGDTLI
jgi:hypothetical protein